MNRTLQRYILMPPRATQIIKDARADNATVVIHTVGAGNTLYLCGWVATFWSSAYTCQQFLEVYDTTPALWKTLVHGGCAASFVAMLSKTYLPPLEIPSGYSVRVRSGGVGSIIRAVIDGWEE